ncbi:MAG: pyruvate kinase [Oligoflexales bacterium]
MLQKNQRQTRVVWSFESSCFSEELLEIIASEEVDAIRLVPESGQLAETIDFMKKLRAKLTSAQKKCPIILDVLAKNSATVVNLDAPKEVLFGQTLSGSAPGKGGDIEIKTENLSTLFPGDVLAYLGNGAVILRVVPTKSGIQFEVVQGGLIYPEMSISIPESNLSPKLLDIPAEEIDLILKNDIDAIVVPGFSDAEDLKGLKQKLDKSKSPPWLILKIASEAGYRNIQNTLPLVRGVLVSRVELAMSLDPAQVPMATKEIIQICNEHGKVVLVASEILGSMRHNATPTRAEISDIANAVLDGADAVVLSEDLPYGRYAQRGLVLARKTILDTENSETSLGKGIEGRKPKINDVLATITYAAYRAAHRNNAKALVCISKEGNTALLLSSFRTPIPIIAVTLSEDVVRRLGLVRGVEGLFLQEAPGIDEVLPLINERLIKGSWLKSGDKIVFVSVTISSIGETASNLFTVQTLR